MSKYSDGPPSPGFLWSPQSQSWAPLDERGCAFAEFFERAAAEHAAAVHATETLARDRRIKFLENEVAELKLRLVLAGCTRSA